MAFFQRQYAPSETITFFFLKQLKNIWKNYGKKQKLVDF